MQDDLNTPEALAAVFEAARQAGQEISTRPGAAEEFASLKEALEDIFGVLGLDLGEEFRSDVLLNGDDDTGRKST